MDAVNQYGTDSCSDNDGSSESSSESEDQRTDRPSKRSRPNAPDKLARQRQFAKVAGNWPTFVFIDVEPTPQCDCIAICSSTLALRFRLADKPHDRFTDAIC
eukprot:SAG31_NODE_70_length_28117_cov_100.521843_18_plen_102_part_00